MSGTRERSRWRFLITPRWLGWHALVILIIVGMFWLGSWQLHRAESGNALSWAYTFEWPLLRVSLDPKVRKSCERRLRLRG